MRTPRRTPVVFVGHGNPMNAIEDNVWARRFRDLATELPQPRAILAVSAHWYVDGTFTTASARPETIHDFGGFPDALYRVQYPAPGDPALARRVVQLLGRERARTTDEWGIDHGTWSVLVHLRPAADLPVVQLSIDGRLPPAEHLALGHALAPLRDEGVLVLASGNVVHNLRHAFSAWRRGENETPGWARSFDAEVAAALVRHDGDALVRLVDTEEGKLAAPTPDHYLPLLYAAGASSGDEPVRFPHRGVRHGLAVDAGGDARRARSPRHRHMIPGCEAPPSRTSGSSTCPGSSPAPGRPRPSRTSPPR
jgi:4,5-DOPA dioxygenase extradiol